MKSFTEGFRTTRRAFLKTGVFIGSMVASGWRYSVEAVTAFVQSLQERIVAIYQGDVAKPLRKSQDNPLVMALYGEDSFLVEPLSPRAKQLLHTKYKSSVYVKEPVLPVEFTINTIFPNPFNGYASIRIGVPSQGKVELEVFNSLGQKVRTLADRNFLPGEHTIIWNGLDDRGRNVSSGVYSVRMRMGALSSTRLVTYVK